MKLAKADPQQLSLALDYKETLCQIRNYLAGQFVGATRDEVLLEEVLKCMFCELYLAREHENYKNWPEPSELAKQYRQAFSDIKHLLPNIFDSQEELLLDQVSLAFINQQLSNFDLRTGNRDPFGDAYEVFSGSIIKGQSGQFFTPQNAIELLVSLVNPQPGETIIDPACGAGGFLNAAARHLITSGISPEKVIDYIFGVDKDEYLVRLASARLSLLSLTSSNVFCADSLAWTVESPLKEKIGQFDIVLANPPFGSRILAATRDTQASFKLGYKWRLNRHTEKFIKLEELQVSVPPQVLFIERCLSLVKPGGRIGIVTPESLISSKNYRYVINYIRENAEIKAVIGMPESLFKISGKSGTHTKTCLLLIHKKDVSLSLNSKPTIFMAEAKWCGHDSRGRQIVRDELPEIAAQYHKYINGKLDKYSHLGYQIPLNKIADNILAPRYYNPETDEMLLQLQKTHDLIKIDELVSSGILQIKTGDEIGKLAYGTGIIPFIRTTDISNWEIKVDPKHCVSEEIYQSLATKQDVKEGDILMVKDGSYLIGTCGYITKYDTRILFQSHIYKLRVKDTSKLSPYLLLAALSSEPVRRQIQSKRFTQDIIDSLGDRIYELVLPIPKDEMLRERITEIVKKSIGDRIEARELARKACLELINFCESTQ